MDTGTAQDNRKLIAHWDRVFSRSEDEPDNVGLPDWRTLAPSDKLFQAAASLGAKQHVLDYGCGSGWASIIAAKSGCPKVTAVDVAPHAAEAARQNTVRYEIESHVEVRHVETDWLKKVPAETYDGLICSNVLDVIPPETAKEIICEAARIVTEEASVIIGMNYYLAPDQADAKGIKLKDGRKVYMDGVLRLVSYSDEEWTELFGQYFEVEKIDHFAWSGEQTERRRLFFLKRKQK